MDRLTRIVGGEDFTLKGGSPNAAGLRKSVYTEELALQFNTWDFPRDGRTVSWDAADMVEGVDLLNKLTFFPKKMYPYRHVVVFGLRTWQRLRHTHLAPKADREGAVHAG